MPITYGAARHQHRLAIAGLGSVLLLWHIASGFAQQQEPVIQLPATSVTAPAPLPESLPRSWIPSRVESLTRSSVQAGHPTVFPEALQSLPGVTLQNEQGNSFQPDLSFRGFTVSSLTGLPQGLSVFLDGVRLNEPTVEEVNFDLIPLEDVERIDVLRGASVLFGRNTLGGAINIVTQRGEEKLEIVPEVSGGSFGHQHYRLRVSGATRPWDYYLSIVETREDGFRDDTASRVLRLFGKLGWQSAQTDLSMSYQLSHNRLKQAGSLPESELHRDRSANFTAGDFFAPDLHQVIVNARHAFTEHLGVQANAFVRLLDAEQFNVNLIAPNSRLVTSTRSAGGTLQGIYRSTLVTRPDVLIVGVEYTQHHVHSRTFEAGTAADEAGPAGEALQADLVDAQNAIGLYVQNTLVLFRGGLGSGSEGIFTLAGRWDTLSHDIADRLGGPSGGRHSFARFNPRVGLNLTLRQGLEVYTSYAEGFRPPALFELTCAGPGAVCPGLQVGVAPDPPLHPVTAQTYEVGLRARPLAWLEADVSGFWTELHNDIFAVSPSGTTGVFFQNVADTRRQGVEVSIRGRRSTLIEVSLNYSFTLATFQDRVELATPRPPGEETIRPGNSLPLVPRHRLNIGLAYHPWSWATLSCAARYVGSQFLRGDEINTERPLPAYWSATLGTSARLWGGEAFVQINNVFNNTYETFGTFAVNGRQPGNPVERFLSPAPPISVLAGVQYRF